MTDDSPNLVGRGRYALVRELGAGAQGTTHEAVDKREGKLVAVKRFTVRGARSWKDVELAEREARVLQVLSHPSLPAYVDHFEEDGCLYLVTDKIEGESLASIRKRHGSLARDELYRVLHDLGGVLEYLHGRSPPVIHRDIKPGNIVRRPDGSHALVDFGAVRDNLRVEGGSTVVGTFGFMAPEQLQGRALPATDVYALGATLLSLMTGRDPEDLPHRGLAIDVRTALGPGADERWISVLTEMLEPDPDRRAASIGPLAARYGLDVGSPPPRAPRQAHRGGRSHAPHAASRERPRRPPHQNAHSAQPIPLVALLVTVAMVAVWVLFEVALPVLLGLLSVVFGRPLREAARQARREGRELQRILQELRYFPQHRVPERSSSTPRVRVDTGAGFSDDDELRAEEPLEELSHRHRQK